MKILIGNDFKVKATVNDTAGLPVDLTEAADLDVIIRHYDNPALAWRPTVVVYPSYADVAVEAAKAVEPGTYTLSIAYTVGSARKYANNVSAFAITANASEASSDSSIAVTLTTEFEGYGVYGLSAYEIAVQQGYKGTVEEWLASLSAASETAAAEARTATAATEAATTAAQAATTEATTATTATKAATTAAQAATEAATTATAAAQAATADTTTATTAAQAATEEATTATTAAQAATAEATTATAAAQAATENATTATTAAQAATASANTATTAAQAATENATTATTAAQAATTAATTATAAAQAATTATEAATAAAETVVATIDARVDAKADKTGTYPTLSVGLSDNLKTTDGVEQAGQRFLYRATADDTTGAGAVSVSDGNAQLRLLSGHTVKQLVDGSFADTSAWKTSYGSTSYDTSFSVSNGIAKVTSSSANGYGKIIYASPIAATSYVPGHIYYTSCKLRMTHAAENAVYFGQVNGTNVLGSNIAMAASTTTWQRMGIRGTFYNNAYLYLTVADKRTSNWGDVYIKDVMLFDLTEMGLAATLTTVAQCEAYFGSDYIPKGVQQVTATKLKSVGFNAFNPANVLAGYKVNEDGTLSAASGYSVVWVKILKSVTSGSMPNNGYVLYEKGGTGLVNAGFMPYEPTAAGLPASTVEGVTTISANPYIYTSNTINGWLVATVTNVADLCVHLRWTDASYDAIYKAYSAYELTLPALSKSYLGGIVRQTGDSTFVEVADELNFVGKKMTERVGTFNLKDYVSGFTLLTYVWKAFVNGTTTVYKSTWNNTVHVAADKYSTQLTVESGTDTTLVIAGVTYTRTSASDVTVIAFVNTSIGSAAGILEQPIGQSFLPNLFMNGYLRARGYYETASYHSSAQLVSQSTGAIVFQDTSCASLAAFKAKVSAMTDAEATVYYIKATETVTAMSSSQSDTYEVSDYGTEEWLNNSVKPYTSTHYYMRNLKDELRNHLDGHDVTWEQLSNKVSTSGWEHIGTSSNDLLYPSAGVVKKLLQVGTSSPTTATVGYVGSLFVDTSTPALWVCTAVTTAESVTTYTWAKLA